MVKTNLTAERARELLDYNAETGVLTRKVTVNYNAVAGSIAGCQMAAGYLTVNVDGGSYLAHRLIWLIATGAWPQGHIDHMDGNPRNNSLGNLRDASREVNAQNQHRAMPGSSTGLLGAYACRDKFRSTIRFDGKHNHLGVFDTPELAHAAYVTAKRIHHPGCTI